MLSSIHPLGERARGQRWPVTAGAHVIGAAAGGAAAGAAAWLLGVPVRAALGTQGRWAVLLAAAALATAVEARPSWVRTLPGLHRQVDDRWLNRYRGWVYGAGYGVQLGAGVLTFVTTAAIPLTLVAAALVDAPWWAVAIGTTFGVVRGATLLAASGVVDGDRLRALHRSVEARAARSRSATQGALALMAALLAAGTVATWT